jgi:transposase-like protein
MTLLELTQKFTTDDACREILTKLRWPVGVECPRCCNKNVWWVDSRKQFTCSECSYQFSALSGTIFNDSHLPLPMWFLAVLLICEAKKGMSAMQLKRTLWGQNKGSYKTAWYLCHRIRAAMATAEKTMLHGTVEMDETFIGGIQHGHQDKAGHGKSTKQIVIGLRQRGGDVRFFHADDVKSGTLAQYIKDNVSEDVDVIMTDEYNSYPTAMKKVGMTERHKTIRHKAKVYVDGDIYTNTVESAFSLLKRGIIGSWHKISAKHLEAYLQEMEFRFNRRHSKTIFIDTLRHMVTADPLTFENLTS